MTAFDCATCGEPIGRADSHVLLSTRQLVCMRHYRSALDAGLVVNVLTQAQASDLLQASIRRPRGPEPASPRRGHRV